MSISPSLDHVFVARSRARVTRVSSAEHGAGRPLAMLSGVMLARVKGGETTKPRQSPNWGDLNTIHPPGRLFYAPSGTINHLQNKEASVQNRRRRHRVSTIAREIQLCEPRTLLSATVTQYGDKAYFVSETAAQIERYDLTSEAWLSPVPLTEGIGLPTVVHVDADGLYVASGQTVYRYELDGSNGTHIMNGSREVSDLMTDGNMLIVALCRGNDPQLISTTRRTTRC